MIEPQMIKTLRCRMGWCQSELAMRLNVSSLDVQSWEAGKSQPDRGQLEGLSALLRLSEETIEDLRHAPLADQWMDDQQRNSVNQSELLQQADSL